MCIDARRNACLFVPLPVSVGLSAWFSINYSLPRPAPARSLDLYPSAFRFPAALSLCLGSACGKMACGVRSGGVPPRLLYTAGPPCRHTCRPVHVHVTCAVWCMKRAAYWRIACSGAALQRTLGPRCARHCFLVGETVRFSFMTVSGVQLWRSGTGDRP